MSAEINASVSLSVSKGGASIATGTLSKTIDMTGSDMATFTQVIGTSNEAVAFPSDISGDVFLVCKNLDSTNYVELFSDSGNANLLSKMNPGEPCLLARVPSTGKLFSRANTASLTVQFWIDEV